MMHATGLDLHTSISVSALSSKCVLDYFEKLCYLEIHELFSFTEKLLQLIFVELRNSHPQYPDYVYKNAIQSFFSHQHCSHSDSHRVSKPSREAYTSERTNMVSFDCYLSLHDTLKSVLSYLCDFLTSIGNELYVLPEKFIEWQYVMTRILPTQVMSYYFAENNWSIYKVINYLSNRYSYVFLYYDPSLNDIIRENIHDLHIHLNGLLEADHVVSDIITRPFECYRQLREQYEGSDLVREFYLQIDRSFKPSELFKMILSARKIREILVLKLLGKEQYSNEMKRAALFKIFNRLHLDFDQLRTPESSIFYRNHPIEWYLIVSENIGMRQINDLLERNPTSLEIIFLYKLFTHFDQLDFWDTLLLYYYLTTANTLKRFLVLQVDQFGLEQFFKLFRLGIREISESNNKVKFLQINGHYRSSISYIEGRLAPKDDFYQLCERIDRIVTDYERLLSEGLIEFTLGLVLHFIKEKESRFEPLRHLSYRRRLMRTATAILQIMNFKPKLIKYICGIDAASVEFYVPPEVFAPTFRFIRHNFRNNYSDFRLYHNELNIIDREQIAYPQISPKITFHVGEDFNHLLSGIRAVYEALIFLPLEPGDRLGHVVALGIDPQLWISRMPESIYIDVGEWLDNLIFVYSILSESYVESNTLYLIEREITRYFRIVYGFEPPDIDHIIKAYICRKLDPEILLRGRGEISMFYTENPSDVVGFEPSSEVWQLLSMYHFPSNRVRYRQKDRVSTKHKVITPELLQTLQNLVLRKIIDMKLCIETMPSSNVKIGFFQNFSEHHVVRWLEQPINNLEFVVCSDDPGLFTTNVSNELAIISLIIKDKTKDVSLTRAKLENLKKTSERYRFFHHRSYRSVQV